MKEIACGDIVPGCDFKASAETEDELLSASPLEIRDDFKRLLCSYPDLDLDCQEAPDARFAPFTSPVIGF